MGDWNWKGAVDGVLGKGEELYEGGKELVGEGIDKGTDVAGDVLDYVGAEDLADKVEDFGDGLASALGAAPGEEQLGDTEEANELVHGNPARIRESVKHLKDFHTAFGKVGEGMRKLDSSQWKGEAADTFREKFAMHPTKWLHAADACEAAAKALDSYADTVAWAQGQAQDAIGLYRKGRKASDEAADAYNEKVTSYNAKAMAGEDPGPEPGPFQDPGKADVGRAYEVLEEARRQRNEAGRTAAASVRAALQHAPAEPSITERLFINGSDLLVGQGTEVTHLVGGAVKGTAGLFNYGRSMSMVDPYNLAHPAEYFENVNMTLAGVTSTAMNPDPVVKEVYETFKKDPSEGVGRLIPDLIGSKGTGLARGGVRATVRKSAEEAVQSGLRRGGRDVVENSADDVSRPPGAKVCVKDPVDVATGRMVLAQADVALPGSLPLVVKRSFESSYRLGGWFGPTWSSTLDQRLEIDAQGVVFVGEDGLVLSYPHPAPGVPTLPTHGPRWPLDRTEDGYTLTDPLSGQVRVFSDRGDALCRLEEIEDRNGNWIAFDYEAGTDALRSITHSGGYRLLFTTDEGRITAVRLAGAASDGSDIELMRYSYSGGHLTEVVNSSGRPLRFGYDGHGRIVSWTDTNGSHFTYVYDDQDRCTEQSGAAGHQRSMFTYEPMDQAQGHGTTTVTDSLGHRSRYLVNERLQVIAETDPLGQTVQYQRDRYNRLMAQTDTLGNTTSFRYDESGNLLSVTRPDGRAAHAEYDEHCLPTKLVRTDGTVVRQAYDDRGNRISVTDSAGNTAHFAYSEAGHLGTLTDPLGNTTTVVRDRAGLPLTIRDPLGAVTRYERDAFGRPVTVTDPSGSMTRLEWTVEGRLSRRTHPDGTTESWTYDGEGNCTRHTDPSGGITRFEYTHFDLLSARTGPDGVRYTFEHDTELRLTRVTNPQGLTWCYEYDPAGRLARETDFDDRPLSYTYDASGHLASRTNALGQVVTFERNELGQTVRKDADGKVTTYAYDMTDQLAQATGPDGTTLVSLRDRFGRLRSETVDGRTLAYTYDEWGRQTGRTTPTGATTTWSYDAAGRPAGMVVSGRSVAFSYDEAGRERTRRVGDTVTLEHVFDELGRMTDQSVIGAAGRRVQHRAYSYRADGNLIGVDDQLGGSRRFDLDATGRVTAVRAADWSETYAYDAAGNQTQADWPADHPGREATGTRTYAGSRIKRAGGVRYEHDELGRIVLRQKTRLSRKPETWRYEWDVEDRLTSVTTPDGTRWRYTYDPLGRRTAKTRAAADGGDSVVERVVFTWDGTTLCEQTTVSDDLPNPVTLTWDHQGLRPLTQTERITAADASQQEIDSRFFSIVTDLVGTPSELLDEQGEIAWRSRSTLWGTTAWTASSTTYIPLRFPGQYYDPETGFHYNYFRHYDPETARYLTPDPLGLAPAPNPSVYVPNPHETVDPFGLSPCPEHLFRGTTRGFVGSPGVQRHGITPTSSDPGVAAVFATHVETFGEAVVEIYPRRALDGIPVHEGYIAREMEWPIELSPSELSSRASARIPATIARDILSEFDIHIPRRVTKGDIDPLLEYEVPKLSPEQIARFVEEAHRRD
ncbi:MULTISPECIES: putative T7SS-secreted protein [unclassified Streptomyces]|uniref:putative T7SS-secreted protein n=1 Tax=unclassified Streptomyces TaxID=2593676 RepID=UPI003D75DF71